MFFLVADLFLVVLFLVVFFSGILFSGIFFSVVLEIVFCGALALALSLEAGLTTFADPVFLATPFLTTGVLPAGFLAGAFLAGTFLAGCAFAAEGFAALRDALAGILGFFAADLADGLALAVFAAFVLEVVFFATLKRSVFSRPYQLRRICSTAVFLSNACNQDPKLNFPFEL